VSGCLNYNQVYETNQPRFISVFSLFSPLRYAVDLTRGIVYDGTSDFSRVVLEKPLLNAAVMVG
jgi:hypothetical protein